MRSLGEVHRGGEAFALFSPSAPVAARSRREKSAAAQRSQESGLAELEDRTGTVPRKLCVIKEKNDRSSRLGRTMEEYNFPSARVHPKHAPCSVRAGGDHKDILRVLNRDDDPGRDVHLRRLAV